MLAKNSLPQKQMYAAHFRGRWTNRGGFQTLLVMFCVKGLLGEHKKNYRITSVPYVLSLLWYQQALWLSSWIVVVKRAGAMGNQPSGVNIPWEVQMSGKAEGWAAAYGFTISQAQAVGCPGPFSRPHTAWATAARLAASGQAFHITSLQASSGLIKRWRMMMT